MQQLLLQTLIDKIGTSTSTRVASAVLENSLIMKASAGALVSIHGFNDGPEQFMQIHDSATVPANGAIPVGFFKMPAASNFSFPFPVALPMTNGIVICNSTTKGTKTIGGANCWFYGQVQ